MIRFNIINKNKSSFIAIIAVALFVVFTSFNDDNDFKLAKNMEIYYDLMRELNKFYVDEIDVEKSITVGITEMLKTLDPYTIYYPESRIEEYRFLTTGQYGGIGALMRNYEDKIIIENIYENYPADKAGFKIGDIITNVEGKEANSKTYENISELMKGLPDTEVEVTVYRPTDKKYYKKRLVRERIKSKDVSYHGMLNDKIGYIKLEKFSPTAYTELKTAFLDLKSQNIEKLVLDLRNNPGGLLIQSVKIVSLFVEKGTHVVSTKGKVKQRNSIYATSNNPLDTEIPIVVLVNSNSASASEIVSGALQDLDRAVIIGERTFGKGLVQTTKDLSYNAKMKLTTAKYYIPSGRCIQALDYTHRNKDGSVGHIPDSLISEFKTLKGRKVYDGGGIMPDISVERKQLSKITDYLLQNMIIFDYATNYAAKHSLIADADKFEISEDDYKEFIKFTISKNISYKTDTEIKLEQLINTAKREKYYTKAKNEIDFLKNKLSHTVEDDLEYFKPQIKIVLNKEIIRRYYYRKGSIINMLANNKPITQAISVLTDLPTYYSILNPKNKK